jgi:hypothetical protein
LAGLAVFPALSVTPLVVRWQCMSLMKLLNVLSSARTCHDTACDTMAVGS